MQIACQSEVYHIAEHIIFPKNKYRHVIREKKWILHQIKNITRSPNHNMNTPWKESLVSMEGHVQKITSSSVQQLQIPWLPFLIVLTATGRLLRCLNRHKFCMVTKILFFNTFYISYLFSFRLILCARRKNKRIQDTNQVPRLILCFYFLPIVTKSCPFILNFFTSLHLLDNEL